MLHAEFASLNLNGSIAQAALACFGQLQRRHVYLGGNDVRVGGNERSEQRPKGFLLVRLDA